MSALDGFDGYTGCPIPRCTGELAGHCVASGECLVGLGLLHLNETCDLQRREGSGVESLGLIERART